MSSDIFLHKRFKLESDHSLEEDTVKDMPPVSSCLPRCNYHTTKSDRFVDNLQVSVKGSNVTFKHPVSHIIVQRKLLSCPVCFNHPLTFPGPVMRRPQDDKNLDKGSIRWICTGPSRSGTSVAFQIMEFFDIGATIKTHNILQIDCPMLIELNGVVSTVRHPYDVFVSWLRLCCWPRNIDPEKIKIDDSRLAIERFDREFSSIMGMVQYKNVIRPLYKYFGVNLCDVVFIRYEDCQKHPTERVKNISDLMNKNISSGDIKEITSKFTIQKNLQMIKRKETSIFSEGHIGPKKGGGEGHMLPKDVKDFIYNRYELFFKEFNYEREK